MDSFIPVGGWPDALLPVPRPLSTLEVVQVAFHCSIAFGMHVLDRWVGVQAVCTSGYFHAKGLLYGRSGQQDKTDASVARVGSLAKIVPTFPEELCGHADISLDTCVQRVEYCVLAKRAIVRERERERESRRGLLHRPGGGSTRDSDTDRIA